MAVKLLALCGSARLDSINARLLKAAVTVARTAGADVTEFALTTDLLPLFDQDREAANGIPPAALALKAAFHTHDGLLIASPEYNGFFTPLLKNAIDWVSRPVAGAPSPFAGKTAALFAASGGGLGGIRGLPHLRLLLSNLGVHVAAGQFALARADQAFGGDGKLADAGQQALLETCIADLLRLTAGLNRI
jgi:NAD(P)H-dependent FMN reductase